MEIHMLDTAHPEPRPDTLDLETALDTVEGIAAALRVVVRHRLAPDRSQVDPGDAHAVRALVDALVDKLGALRGIVDAVHAIPSDEGDRR
jgi:hypothetical protein